MIDYRHQIHIKVAEEVIGADTSSLRDWLTTDIIYMMLDIALLSAIAVLFYYALRSKITNAAMISSKAVWYRALPVFVFSLLLSIPMMGVTLGAIISRQLLGRNITVDWYSVIGGTLLIGIIYHLPYINLIVLGLIYVLTFVALIQSYIVRE